MPVLPYQYLGPGNHENSGEPVDEDDRIAQEHDSAYATALTAEDISNADAHAINDFWHDFRTTGAAGLSIKYGIESQTGTLYPDMSKRPSKYRSLLLVRQGQHERHTEHLHDRRQGDQDVRRDGMQDPGQPATSHDVSDIVQEENNNPMNTDEVDAPQQDNGGVPPAGGVTNPHNSLATLHM